VKTGFAPGAPIRLRLGRRARCRLLAGALCAGLACSPSAAPQTAPQTASPPAAAGVLTVAQRAEVCLGCHGTAGRAANPLMPSISGQPRQFIATELFQFREGHRKSELMSPMAAGLSNTEMNELAAFFSALKPDPPARTGDAQKAGQAKELVQKLNCVSCHTPTLTGQQHIPRLAGQQYEYVRVQLRGFRAATRADIDGLMTSAAQPLSDSDIDAVADYVSALEAP
jgi:cytochrome c553